MSLLEDLLRKSQTLEDQLQEDRAVLRSIDLLFGLWVKNEEAASTLRQRDELLNSSKYQTVIRRAKEITHSPLMDEKEEVWCESIVVEGRLYNKMYNKFGEWDGCLLDDKWALLRYQPAFYRWNKFDADIRIQKQKDG